ncbi:hypothetical protein O181_037207 [Austropuccinia psidii MF-1]|uniref:Uncharacterized protein n=1 Tax=Austropuccinia psidii MF-1 TaxID=1389203 RepID=A0A9Q3DC79_9BASI|nr:hypothetical protein [Austropuccinia psidii MF-1]
MPLQAPDVSHTHPYTSTGSQQFKPLLALGKAPNNSNHSLHQCRLLKIQKQTLLLVQVPKNSNNYLHQGRLPTVPTIPYACPGSQCFTCKSLCLDRFPKIQTPYIGAGLQKFEKSLTPVQPPDTSHANPYACTGSQQLEQFLTLVQAPNASHNSLHM